MPADLRELAENTFDETALAQRRDVERLNGTLQTGLAAKGLVINTPDIGPFRSTLRAAGFHPAWKRKFGAGAWSLLESYSGPLA